MGLSRKKRNIYMRKYYAANRDSRLKYNREYQRKNREKLSEYWRIKKYNITSEEYYNILKKQKGKCAICKKSDVIFHIDHDHKCCPTKASCCGECIRGLLCSQCNFGLGNFGDNKMLLINASKYLVNYEKENI